MRSQIVKMNSILQSCNKIYFEALCIVDLNEVTSIPAAKLSKFSKESGMIVYFISFFEGKHLDTLFLTKQKLVPNTGYYCKTNQLTSRSFASVEVLLGNNVKRVLAKSDSKFIEKFSNLLTVGQAYVRFISENDFRGALMFSSPKQGTLQFDFIGSDLVTSPEEEANSFEFHGPPLINTSLVPTLFTPPNIICTLYQEPNTIIEYVKRKSREKLGEEIECRRVRLSSESIKGSRQIKFLGSLVLEENESETKEEAIIDEDKENRDPKMRGNLVQEILNTFLDPLDAEEDQEPDMVARTMELLNSKEKERRRSEGSQAIISELSMTRTELPHEKFQRYVHMIKERKLNRMYSLF